MIKQVFKQLLSERTRINVRLMANKIIAPLYYGDNFYCNCCEKKFSKFLPKGNITRQNAKCPYCGSLERTRILLEYLRGETNLFTSKITLLHLAPEYSLFNIFKKLDIEYIDADINPNYANHEMDITNINYSDNYFDLIICSHILAHIKDENKALMELYRVLKTNQKLLILTLIENENSKTVESNTIMSENDTTNHTKESLVYRIHGNDYLNKLKSFGFVVNKVDYRQKFNPKEIEKNRFGDGKREMIIECTKV
jgi:SAM-dependent methyltransferase